MPVPYQLRLFGASLIIMLAACTLDEAGKFVEKARDAQVVDVDAGIKRDASRSDAGGACPVSCPAGSYCDPGTRACVCAPGQCCPACEEGSRCEDGVCARCGARGEPCCGPESACESGLECQPVGERVCGEPCGDPFEACCMGNECKDVACLNLFGVCGLI